VIETGKSESYSTLMAVNNLDGILITQMFPQTIRREYDETVTWLKSAGDDGWISTQ
jgi:hypothetical protein